jgi:hypothetical protein
MSDAPNAKARAFRVEFDESIVRRAVRRIVLESFRSALLWAVSLVLVGLGGLVLVTTLATGWSALVHGVLAVLVAGGLFWAAVILSNYLVSLRESLRLLKLMPSRTVEFQIDSIGISATSSAWSGTIPWNRTTRLIRPQAVMLIGLGGTQVTRDGKGQVKVHSALGEDVLSGEALLNLWRLPILWPRPGMSQLFLVVPTVGVPDGAQRIIIDSVQQDPNGLGSNSKRAF